MLYNIASKLLSIMMNCLAILKRIEQKEDDLGRNQLVIAGKLDAQAEQQAIQQHILNAQTDLLAAQQEQLKQILAALTPSEVARVRIVFEMEGLTYEGELKGMKAGGSASYSVVPEDQFGNPAKLDGPLNVAVSDETIIRIKSKSDDGLTGVIESVGLLGSATFSVDGDADLGSGVKPVVGSALIAVDQPGEVAQLKISVTEN